MEYARHEAYLNAPARNPKGEVTGVNRDHLEMAAAKGSARAIAALYDGPEIPEPISYLWEWAQALFGKSGVGMNGYAPLSYATIAHWARLTDNEPEPHEVEALFQLDAILLNPPKDVS